MRPSSCNSLLPQFDTSFKQLHIAMKTPVCKSNMNAGCIPSYWSPLRCLRSQAFQPLTQTCCFFSLLLPWQLQMYLILLAFFLNQLIEHLPLTPSNITHLVLLIPFICSPLIILTLSQLFVQSFFKRPTIYRISFSENVCTENTTLLPLKMDRKHVSLHNLG